MWAILREPRKIVPLCIAVLFFFTLYQSKWPYRAKVIFYPVLREIKKNSTILSSKKFNNIKSDRFNIYYKDTSEKCLEIVTKNAQQSLNAVLYDFDYYLEKKIDLIIYPEYEEMADKIGLGSGSPAMGVYYGGVISILEPTKWIEECRNLEYIYAKDGPMVHELTHYVLDYMSGGNMPIWFTEGVALYEEYSINGVEWAKNNIYTDYYDINSLEKDFYGLDEVKAYKQAFLIIKYIEENFSMMAVKSVVRELKSGKSTNQAINNVLGLSIDELFKKSLTKEATLGIYAM